MEKPGNDRDVATVLQTDEPKVVVFGAKWCAPCKKLEENIEHTLEQEYPEVRFIKIDVELCPQSAISHGVNGLPTILFLRGEEEFHKQYGFGRLDTVREAINGISGR